MKPTIASLCTHLALLSLSLVLLASACVPGAPALPRPITVVVETPIPTAEFAGSTWTKMDPPPDSDKAFPVHGCDASCWMHTASNMLAGAGYGDGDTVQERARDIWNDMSAHFPPNHPKGCTTHWAGGWPETAMDWWLGSAHNTWTDNPYTLETYFGNKDCSPWTDRKIPRDIGNTLFGGHYVGLCIRWPKDGAGCTGGHAVTAWGHTLTETMPLTNNPTGIVVTDSDQDSGGDVEAYTYDAYTSPNPGGPNEGNGWYYNAYGSNHPFIIGIATLSDQAGPSDKRPLRVVGSYRIHQSQEEPATDLHYVVGTDVDILSYRTWLDWDAGTSPVIREADPRQEIEVDWDLSQKEVPYYTWLTVSTEFVVATRNAISYRDAYFTYSQGEPARVPDLAWWVDTPVLDDAEPELIPNVTGGYVIGAFDVYAPDTDEMVAEYRLVHQYLYNQSPEFHVFIIGGTEGYRITNLRFGHRYGYPTVSELWADQEWMSEIDQVVRLRDDERPSIVIDWSGQLPYPEGLSGACQGQ